MLVKTEAIVLGAVKYGDSSVILRTYSEEYGLLSFIAGGVRSKKGPVKASMTQVLSVVQLVYYSKAKGQLKRIKEASVPQPLQEVFYHPVKSSLAMFLAEILQHVIHEEEANQTLYRYLRRAIYELDELTEGLGSFHLKFLYRLTSYLGFQPEDPLASRPYFDLLNGVYSKVEPMHAHYLNGTALLQWLNLHEVSSSFEGKAPFDLEQRRQLLDNLILYYRLHVKDFGKLRSLEILTEVLS